MFPPLEVVSNVIVTLPLPDDSAFEIGGFSLEGDNTAVNVGRTVLGEVDDPPHAATKKLSAMAKTERCFIR
jgi:hypothetical protein